MSSVDEALENMRTLLACRLCGGQLRATVTLQECGHHFCHTCVYSELGSTCQCPTCHLPARVGNLLKNPTYDILVACASKLADLRRDVSPPVENHHTSQPSRSLHGKGDNSNEDREDMDDDFSGQRTPEGTPLGSVIWTADCGPTFPHSEPLHLYSPSPSSSMRSSNVDLQTFPSVNAALANHGREKFLRDKKNAATAAASVARDSGKGGRSSSQISAPSSLGSSNVDMQTFPSVNTAMVIHEREKALQRKATVNEVATTEVHPDTGLSHSTETTDSPAETGSIDIIPMAASRIPSRAPSVAPAQLELTSTSLSIPAPGAEIVTSRPTSRPTMSQLQNLLNINRHKNQHLREESCIPSSQENENPTQTFPLPTESEPKEEEMSYHTPRMPSMPFYSLLLPNDPQSAEESEGEGDSSHITSRKRVATTVTEAALEHQLSAVKEKPQDQERDGPKRQSIDRGDRVPDRRPPLLGMTIEVQSSQPSADLMSPTQFY